MKLLFKVLIFSGICLFLLGFVMDPIFKNFNNANRTFYEFNKTTKDSLDILFIGSSHSKTTFKPSIFDSIYNIQSFNIGTGGQRYLLTNLLLEDLLKKKDVKLVVVDLYPALLNVPKDSITKGFQLRVLDNVDFTTKKAQLINTLYGIKEQPSVYSETIRNHDNWHSINFDDKTIESSKSFVFDKGWLNSNKTLIEKDRILYADFLVKNSHFLAIKPTDSDRNRFELFNSYVEETIRICEKYNTKLCFVSAPYFASFYKKESNKKHYYLKELLTKKDVDFLDFNSKFNTINLTLNDFKDQDHLNIEGSRKVSVYFSKYLNDKEYFEIKDLKYYNQLISKIKPRSKDSVTKKINNLKTNLINEIIRKGNKSLGTHEEDNNKVLESVFFYKKKSANYMLIQIDTLNTFKSNNFLLRGEVHNKDFDKRPKSLLGTDKNKIFWNVKADTILLKDKRFYIFEIKNKGSINSYKSFSIFAKDENGKHSRKGYVMKNISFIKE